MNIALIAFTKKGHDTALYIANNLPQHNNKTYVKGSFSINDGVVIVNNSLSSWIKDMFTKEDAVIFVGATGIAVRTIAPHLNNKFEDPAIVVVDEKGQYVISLLSGHVGGANNLTKEIADAIDATPIITTATDINDCFSVDSWAKSQDMKISDKNLAKLVSANLLEGLNVGFITEVEIEGSLPEELVTEACDINILISTKENISSIINETIYANKRILQLIPKALVLGIGCRKGISVNKIEEAVKTILKKENISMDAITTVASIELKKNEQGLVGFCANHSLPFYTYSATELSEARGSFTKSEFVNGVTGVDNVCERSAVMASKDGLLIVPKQSMDGVTIAIARKERTYKWT